MYSGLHEINWGCLTQSSLLANTSLSFLGVCIVFFSFLKNKTKTNLSHLHPLIYERMDTLPFCKAAKNCVKH